MSDPLPNRCLPGKVPSTHMMAGAKVERKDPNTSTHMLGGEWSKPTPIPSPGAQLTEADVRRIVREEIRNAATAVRDSMLRFQAGPQ